MDTVIDAIADPVRREILDMLSEGERTVGEITGRFTISRPAVSRHLRVLRTSGLVTDELVGRQRFYSLTPEPLREVARWIDRVAPQGELRTEPPAWRHRLDALETEVRRTGRERRTGTGLPASDADDQRTPHEQSNERNTA